MRKFLFLLLSAVLLLGIVPLLGAQSDDDDTLCPLGKGYWANHAEAWSGVSLMLGDETYTQAELLALLPGSDPGDASLILAGQLIAAKLNVLAGVAGDSTAALVAQGDALLALYDGKLPYDVAPSSTDGQLMVLTAGSLDLFNSGATLADCAALLTPEPTADATPDDDDNATAQPTPDVTAQPTAQPTPDATPDDDGGLTITIVIEGEVEAINVNIITIYGIDITLDPDEPLLLVLQVGDVVRIEGNVADDDDTSLTIVVVVIVLVNTDTVVVIDGGGIWRDDGDCANPPPDWAPANGWRRRCDPNYDPDDRPGRGNDDDDDDDDD